ncbi:phage tail protein [Halalkalibacter okhensis]|uniref:Phage-related minor tail protein n=1 Tax=Halalkalibacter okhensis TaxID=333138 RepID=A0A0B0IN21_9BACI|nr:phage tail protein [Halalkalibacter okhensis]KHF41444.1 phage-related minor tail protein [Halalkalibacter okhensis]
MSDNFGLKIGVEGEKEFKNALRDINRNFKVLGSEMKLVSSQFDKQDKSVQAVTARNAVLNKEIDAQKDKVGMLEKALANAASSFGENDRRTQAWQIQLNNAKAALNGMESELEENNRALEAASDGFDEAGDEAEKFGDDISDAADTADDAGGKFEKLGSIVKGVAVGIGVAMAAIGTAAVTAGKKLYDMANDAAAAGDEIDKASQRVGFSKEAYQEWDYVLSQNGASIDTLDNGMKKLNNTVDDAINGSDSAAKRFERLGISMDDLQGKSREEIFEMTVRGLQGMTNESERAAVANDLLGSSSVELSALLNQTAEGTDELRQKAHELGLVMSEDAVNAAVEYTDAMDNFTRTFQAVKNNIASELLPGFTMILDGLTGLITGQEGASEKLKQGAEETVKQIGEILPRILDVVTGLISAIAEVAPDLMMALVNGIIENLPTLITAATNIIMTLVGGIIEALPQVTEGALQLVLALVNGIVENLPSLVEAALVMVVTLAEGIGEAIPELIPVIVETIMVIVNTIISNLDMVLDAAFKIIEGLAIGLINALPKLIEALPTIIITLINFITGNLPKIVEMGVRLIVQLAAGILQAIPQLVAQLPQVISALLIGLGKAVVSIGSIGREIVRGLWNGIASMIGWIKEKIGGFVGGIVSNVKGVLGIRSPSRVFAGIGENMGEGIGEGFSSAMRDVEKDMEGAIPTDFDLDLNSEVGATAKGANGSLLDVTIPLTIDGTVLTRIIAQLQWNQNTVTIRNLGVART